MEKEVETPTAAAVDIAVIMVPFLAQGHLNQLLHLSRLLSARGLPVHYVGSANHNRQARMRVHGWDPLSASNIHFHDVPLPRFPTPPPDPKAPIKFPDHLRPAWEATAQLRQPFASLLRTLSLTSRRLAIVFDSLMAFAAQEASKFPNAESYVFLSVSAFAHFFFNCEEVGHDNVHVEMPKLPPLSSEGCFTRTFVEFMAIQDEQMKTVASFSGNIRNTCRSIEGQYIDLMVEGGFLDGKKTWAIGPLNPTAVVNGADIQRHPCLEWLDKQPPKSVIYVSFGTTSCIEDEQIVELALGLERSEQRFLWVLREADRGDIFADEGELRKLRLPEDYEKRVKGIGFVERGWAPQLEILGHPSVGGFMSHCGWNSCMESMSMGVPIAAWPMHSDQPRNAMLVTEVLKIGMTAREWGRREEVVSAVTVEDVVKRLMASEEGKEVRKRAEELGHQVRREQSVGSSRTEFDSFVGHISRK